jgi:hypothetical protein
MSESTTARAEAVDQKTTYIVLRQLEIPEKAEQGPDIGPWLEAQGVAGLWYEVARVESDNGRAACKAAAGTTVDTVKSGTYWAVPERSEGNQLTVAPQLVLNYSTPVKAAPAPEASTNGAAPSAARRPRSKPKQPPKEAE